MIVGAEGRLAIGTLVDRASRYLLLVHLPVRRSAGALRDALTAVLGELPESARLTLTWDLGSEVAYHDQIALLVREGVFFAHPASPWQRGTNEKSRPPQLRNIAEMTIEEAWSMPERLAVHRAAPTSPAPLRT